MMLISAALATVQPGASSGFIPVVTALGGVAVSIFTVYKNAQKQAQFTGENTGHIQSLGEQIGMLNSQVIELKSENASLTTELRLLRESHEASQSRRHRYEDQSDADDDEPPRRKKKPEPQALQTKKKKA